MIILNMILMMFFLLLVIFAKLKLKNKVEQYVLYFFSKKSTHFYKSIIIIVLFIIFFVFFLRVLRILAFEQRYFDLKIFLKFGFFDSKYYLTIILFVIFFFKTFIIFKNFIFSSVRFHFFRIYIHFFFEKKIVMNIYNFFFSLESSFIKFFDKRLFFLSKFIFNYWFKIILLFLFMFDIIFNNFVINLQYMPIYGLIYFIYGIHKFSTKMKTNFDYGLYLYNNNSFIVTKEGIFKLNNYIKFLIIGYSSYVFYDSYDLYKYLKEKKIHENVLYFDLDKDSYLNRLKECKQL